LNKWRKSFSTIVEKFFLEDVPILGADVTDGPEVGDRGEDGHQALVDRHVEGAEVLGPRGVYEHEHVRQTKQENNAEVGGEGSNCGLPLFADLFQRQLGL